MVGSSEAMLLQFSTRENRQFSTNFLQCLLGGKHGETIFRWILDWFYRDPMMVTLPFYPLFHISLPYLVARLHLDGHVSLFVIGAKNMSIEGLDSSFPNGWFVNHLPDSTCDQRSTRLETYQYILSQFQLFYSFKPSIVIMFDHFDLIILTHTQSIGYEISLHQMHPWGPFMHIKTYKNHIKNISTPCKHHIKTMKNHRNTINKHP